MNLSELIADQPSTGLQHDALRSKEVEIQDSELPTRSREQNPLPVRDKPPDDYSTPRFNVGAGDIEMILARNPLRRGGATIANVGLTQAYIGKRRDLNFLRNHGFLLGPGGGITVTASAEYYVCGNAGEAVTISIYQEFDTAVIEQPETFEESNEEPYYAT